MRRRGGQGQSQGRNSCQAEIGLLKAFAGTRPSSAAAYLKGQYFSVLYVVHTNSRGGNRVASVPESGSAAVEWNRLRGSKHRF